MSKPMGCPDVVYSIMCRCWVASAEQRASAADVEALLGRVSEAQVAGLAAVTAFEGTQLAAGQSLSIEIYNSHD